MVGSFFLKPALGAAAYGAGALYSRFAKKRAVAAKPRRRRMVRRQATTKNAAGVRSLTFPKPVLSRGLNKDFVFAYDGNLATAAAQFTYGNSHVFKLNDPFDPVSGGETLQPLYFDQFAALYSKYRVWAVTVEVRWTSADTTHIVACALKIGPSVDTLNIQAQSTRYVNAMPLTNVCRISPAGEHTFIVGPRRFLLQGIEGEQWLTKGDSYQANTTASPTLSPTLQLAVACMNNADAVSMNYSLRIIYHTRLFDPIIPAESL